MTSTTPRVAVLHLSDTRPHAPGFHALLGELTAATLQAIDSLGWQAEVVASGDHPVAVSLAAARAADAVVILGGEDVSPEFYGGPADYPGSGHHVPAADEAHLAVIHEAIRDGRPLLGICRGHQLINVALGGTLVQHLDAPLVHRNTSGDDPFVTTALDLDPDIADDVEGSSGLCTHHQAIDRLGRDLRVVGRAPDGVIEAVVHTSAPVTGVQWHPEHPTTAPTALRRLLLRLDRPRTTRMVPDASQLA